MEVVPAIVQVSIVAAQSLDPLFAPQSNFTAHVCDFLVHLIRGLCATGGGADARRTGAGP